MIIKRFPVSGGPEGWFTGLQAGENVDFSSLAYVK